MEVDDFIDTMHRLSRPSTSLLARDRTLALTVAHAFRTFQRQRLQQLVFQYKDEPAMFVYMADGWGAKIKSSMSCAVPDSHLVINRVGHLRHDFVLQRGLALFCRPDGGVEKLLVMEWPIGMGNGRKTGHNCSASCDFFTSLRALGHEGMNIQLYLVD